MAAVIESLPPGRTLRVLEVGAGTGGSTAAILPALPPYRTEYLFTDLSRLFTTRAEEKFRDYPFVRYALLDIERSPLTQGIKPQYFDLIVASNVLHATRDLRETLRHIRELLVPGGLLFLLEGTRPHLWVEVTFGLTEGWWRFADAALRPFHPLLTAKRWVELLREVGFSDAAAVPETVTDAAVGHQAILLAREPLATRRAAEAGTTRAEGTWLIFGEEAGLGRALADRVREGGERALHVTRGQKCAETGVDEWTVDPSDAGHFRHVTAMARHLVAADADLRVVHLWGLDARIAEEDHPGRPR